MVFSSITFIFIFLPLVLAVFYIIPKRFKNLVLLLASLIFYAWGGVSYTAILIISILLNYFIGRGVALKSQKLSKTYLTVGILINLLLLVVFKYADFLIENLNPLIVSFNIPAIKQPHILLPIGISFFTFQALSYLIDIYRKETSAQKKFVDLALYISLFPQLIAGPIVRYHDIFRQLAKRTFTLYKFHLGIQRFIIGLSKKVLLANQFAVVADDVFSLPTHLISTPTAWIGLISYSFQIYFDFSGYSDMAIGLGKMFGFDILENFNFPYISKSIREFWKRWHISLSSWFKDYLYIPLGGNRKGNGRTYLNLFIVFLLTGFWHGASWNFIVWGLIHGFFMIIERIGFNKLLNKLWLPLRHMYTLGIVGIAWVFFRAEKLDYALEFFKVLMGKANETQGESWLHYFNKLFIIVLIIALSGASGVLIKIYEYMKITRFYRSLISLNIAYSFRVITLLLFFILSCISILSGSYNPFIYFRF